ncbi:MAG: DEAD/DEAH box helicase, partial [Pseudomonadales bacterium]|nr:DEAD/DEAH box helicase [Pseudomonadales bacterium]
MISLNLPIEAVLPELLTAMQHSADAILEAPPGAGKTTLVPLALLEQPWLGHQKILMLEPRRIAARSAAHRMASLLHEQVGETIGYRMRLDTKVGKHTRVEVITDGILTRMLQEDPALSDVGLIIFDEFHERSLDADLALALCLKGREIFREKDDPLRLLIMSATLNGEALSAALCGAPVIRSEGKQFPVDIVYGVATQPRDPIVDKVVSTTLKAIEENPDSNFLVFLPGQGE